MKFLAYRSPPTEEFRHKIADVAGVRILIRREDQNHPLVSGNKWWKLRYNLEAAARQGRKTLLTFGGAFSNHIFATAAAAGELNFKSIGIIRGEESLPFNPTLSFAKEMGMELHFISREVYRKKDHLDFIQKLSDQLGDFYLIPEGGTNKLAVQGCAELASKELMTDKFHYLCLPVGTGGTMAGLICGLPATITVIGIPVLKNGEFLKAEIENLIQDFAGQSQQNWSLLTSYHHGGYAKVTDDLLRFIREMNELHNLPLDPVYTGKLMWAVLKETERGTFKSGSTILVLHTGGMQAKII